MTNPRLAFIPRALLVAAASQVGVLHAQSLNIVDGDGKTGIMLFEDSHVYGEEDAATVYTNFFTEGGAGSGGGAGLGGVFFVNSGTSLTLRNVSFMSNTVKGGEGGSLPPANVGGFTMAVIERTTAVTKVPDLSATPDIQWDAMLGKYVVEKATVGNVSPTFKVGNAASFGGTLGVSSIASISGKEITFAEKLVVADDAVFEAPTLPYEAGKTTVKIPVDINGDPITAGEAGKALNDALFIGRTLVAPGLPAGTKIENFVLNGQGRVTELTLSQPADANGLGFDILKVETFTAAQFQAVSDTQIVANATGLGLAVGMVLTGDGIPEGTRVASITPIAGSNNSTITFSQPVNQDGKSTLGFDAKLPVLGDTPNVLRLSGGDPRLVVGMRISGDGIADGTTITAIDAENGLLTLSQNVLSAPEEFKVSNVSNQAGNVLTMINVKGLVAGMTVTGENVPDGTTILSVVGNVVTLSQAPEGDITSLTAFSPLTTGGSLNGMKPAEGSTRGSDGRGGYSGRPGAAFLMEGEGQDGTNGYNANKTEPSGSSGGNGGAGGNGSNGIPFNWALTWEIASLSFDLGVTISEAVAAATNFDEADPLLPHPDPDFGEMAVKIAAASIIAVDLGTAITNLTLWSIDMSRGLVARGGAGGDGGEGGDGDEFFGGGAGGAGGRGGEGGASWTDGGDGGSGGIGGRGGFGAGGGSGGAPGDAGSTGQGSDGDKGDGGRGGFGAGEGTDGNGEFGGGGSGYGGAIFIRDGGFVTITGDSVFENNATLGGSSNNGGEGGQAAGTDIFLMKGAELYLAPGAGKTIRLEGTIADNSMASIDGGAYASGYGATVRFGGGGLVQLNGENTYTGLTQIEGATVQADDGVGINVDSHIHFVGAGRLGSLVSGENTGALLTSGEIVRRVGTLPNQLTWAGAGGFAAATEEDLVLNFGRIGNAAAQVLRWNSAGISDDSVIVFGSEYGQGSVRLLNSINLNGSTGKFAVYGTKPGEGDEGYAASHSAFLQGYLYNGTIEVGSAGMDGLLTITGSNELTGATFHSGVTSVLGRLFKPGVGGNLLITNNGSGAGEVILWNDELILDATVEEGGVLTAAGAISLVDLDNAGTINLGGRATARSVTNRDGGELKVLGDLVVTADGEGTGGFVLNEVGGTLIQGSDITVSTAAVNNGQWTVVGTPADGEFTLSAAQGLFGSGNLTLSRSTFKVDGAEDIVVDPILNLEVGADGEGYYLGTIDGAGSLVKTGAGSQVLAGNNSFTGDLVAAAGTLSLEGTQDDLVDVIVRSGANLVFRQVDKVNSVTVDAGGFAYVEQNLSTTVDFTSNGTTAMVGNRTLTLGGGLAGSGLVSVSGAGQTLVVDQDGDTTYSGSIEGLGQFTKTGAGTLTLSGAAGSLDLAGGVVVDGGTLALDGEGILDNDLNLLINLGGTLELVNGTQVANSISGLGTIDLGDGNTLEVNDGGDFEGTVTGSGILRVAGGDLNVTNITSTSGTYSSGAGATTNIANGGSLTFPDLVVQAGSTLHFGATGTNTGASNVNVSGSANIYGNVTGTGTLTGNTTTHAGANIAPGNSPGILTFAGNLTVSALTNFDMELEGFAGAGVNPGGHDVVEVGGDLAINGGSLTIQQLSGFELGRGQSLRIFEFGAGRVSGQFDTATSEMSNPVFYSLATGNVTGYGAGGRSALLAAIAPNLNQAAMLSSTLVETDGGVDQVYGGRLLDALAAAVEAGESTDRVFELSTAERHGGLLTQARGTLLGAMAELPAESAVPADGWSLSFSGGSLDSAEEGEQHLGYKVSRNSATILRTTPQPLGALTLGLSLDEGKVTGGGYRADSVGLTLGVGYQRKLESVPGLALGLRAGLSRQITDTSRETLGETSTAEDVDSQSTVVGAGIGYARAFGSLNFTANLEALVFRSSVDGFRENNVSSLDALEVAKQEDNGTAVVAGLGLSGKVSESFTLGGDLRLTSFSGSEYHNVESSVLTEDVATTVTHQANGQNILGLGLFGSYRIDAQSSIRLGGRAEGDGGLSDGYRFDLSYRRDF